MMYNISQPNLTLDSISTTQQYMFSTSGLIVLFIIVIIVTLITVICVKKML